MFRLLIRQLGLLLLLPALIGWRPAKVVTATYYADHLGLVNLQPSKACLFTRNAMLTAGTEVLAVLLTTPQAILPAQIVRKSTLICPPGNPGDLTLSGYELHIDNRIKRTASFAIAIFPPPRITEQAGLVFAELGGKKQSFHSCTSVDGAHFTAWENKPLIGRPVWHQYYYLGYDVESNCSNAETVR